MFSSAVFSIVHDLLEKRIQYIKLQLSYVLHDLLISIFA